MKNIKTLLAVAVISGTTFLASCEKDNQSAKSDLTTDVVGTYKGTITDSAKKSTNGGDTNATADVTPVNDYTVQVHCYGGDLDTTYNVTLYPNGDEMMTGMTGEDFEEMYGYMPDYMQEWMDSNMNGGSMGSGDMMGSDWMNYEDHMSQNHDDNDYHDGSFDMANGTFNYTFDANTDNSRNFSGKK